MAAPATPTGLNVLGTFSNAININWTPSAGATGYNIYISTDDITYAKILNEYYHANFIVGIFSLAETTQYYFKISAINTDGESALTTSVNSTTLSRQNGTVQGVAVQRGPFAYDINGAKNVRGIGYRQSGIDSSLGRIIAANLESATIFNTLGIYFLGLFSAYGFMEAEVEGSWRLTRSGDDLVFQRYESSSWITKSTISA